VWLEETVLCGQNGPPASNLSAWNDGIAAICRLCLRPMLERTLTMWKIDPQTSLVITPVVD
jgi:hypothetical protein